MTGKGELTSLLIRPELDMKKITEFGRSRKLDVDELVTIAVKYASMVSELGPDLNPLHVACIRNRPDVVLALVKEGYDVNAEIGKIDSYLRIALDFGNIPVAHLLLVLGADAHSTYNDGKTPMESALSTNKREKTCATAIRLLLEAGVSVNADAISDTEEKPLHLATKNNLPSVVSLLLQKGADGDTIDSCGSTPLHNACYKNFVDIIKLLILHKVKLHSENAMNDSPLLIVTRAFFKEALKVLISGGCDINMLMANGTCSALHVAVEECNLDKVTYLVSLGADPNKQLSNGRTPMHVLAARPRAQTVDMEKTKAQASVGILEFLLQKGANVNATTINRNTPLQLAVSNKYFKLAKQLVKLGASINERTSHGKILFHHIACFNNDITNLFLEYGADYSKNSEGGWTPYHFAITNKVDIKFIKSFVQFGCPYNQNVALWSRTKMGGSDEFQQFFKAEEQFFKGIRENNLSLVKKAVEGGAVPTGSSDDCAYPLHFAAFHGYGQILKYLLENSSPANAVDSEGETALFIAAKKGHYDICCTLLQFGACYNYHSKKCSKTPELAAVEFGHKSIVGLFQQVAKMFYLARSENKCFIKDLTRIHTNSPNKYLMYANSINIRGETLLSTSLHFNCSENARSMMKLRVSSLCLQND